MDHSRQLLAHWNPKHDNHNRHRHTSLGMHVIRQQHTLRPSFRLLRSSEWQRRVFDHHTHILRQHSRQSWTKLARNPARRPCTCIGCRRIGCQQCRHSTSGSLDFEWECILRLVFFLFQQQRLDTAGAYDPLLPFCVNIESAL